MSAVVIPAENRIKKLKDLKRLTIGSFCTDAMDYRTSGHLSFAFGVLLTRSFKAYSSFLGLDKFSNERMRRFLEAIVLYMARILPLVAHLCRGRLRDDFFSGTQFVFLWIPHRFLASVNNLADLTQ